MVNYHLKEISLLRYFLISLCFPNSYLLVTRERRGEEKIRREEKRKNRRKRKAWKWNQDLDHQDFISNLHHLHILSTKVDSR